MLLGTMLRIALAVAFSMVVRAAAAQTPVATLPSIQWQKFVDPQEGMFSMDAPAAWRVSGGLARRNALQYWPWLAAVSPDGNTILAFGDPTLQSYVLPTPILAATGFREGSVYSPGSTVYIVSRYVPGPDFAVLYAERQLPHFCTDIQPTSRGERADMAARIGTGTRTTAGEARFACRKDGAEMAAYVFCATSEVSQGGIGFWYPSFLFAYLAPKPLAGIAEQMVAHMLGTIAVNPQWLAAQTGTSMAVSRITTGTGHAISDTIMQGWQARNATIDRMMEEGSRARLGIDIYANPATGTRYTVANTHNYYWVDPQGRVVGTETNTPPAGFAPLQRVPPGG